MSSVKQQLQEIIEILPEDCTMEDFRYHLYVRQRIEEGMQAIDEGRFYSHEEAVEIVKSWRKSSGPNQP